jgi:hypothetical protein
MADTWYDIRQASALRSPSWYWHWGVCARGFTYCSTAPGFIFFNVWSTDFVNAFSILPYPIATTWPAYRRLYLVFLLVKLRLPPQAILPFWLTAHPSTPAVFPTLPSLLVTWTTTLMVLLRCR